MLTTLSRLMRLINGVNRVVGQVCSWMALALVLVCFSVVLERYLLGQTRLWSQDLYIWLNGAMFTSVAGFALLRDDHVRVDIFYRPASMRRKAIADLIGVLVFLLPFVLIVSIYSQSFVQRSWRILEGSANVGGLPGLFVLKSFLFVFAVLVGLQGLSMAIRSVLVLCHRIDLVPVSYRYRSSEPLAEVP